MTNVWNTKSVSKMYKNLIIGDIEMEFFLIDTLDYKNTDCFIKTLIHLYFFFSN